MYSWMLVRTTEARCGGKHAWIDCLFGKCPIKGVLIQNSRRYSRESSRSLCSRSRSCTKLYCRILLTKHILDVILLGEKIEEIHFYSHQPQESTLEGCIRAYCFLHVFFPFEEKSFRRPGFSIVTVFENSGDLTILPFFSTPDLRYNGGLYSRNH